MELGAITSDVDCVERNSHTLADIERSLDQLKPLLVLLSLICLGFGVLHTILPF